MEPLVFDGFNGTDQHIFIIHTQLLRVSSIAFFFSGFLRTTRTVFLYLFDKFISSTGLVHYDSVLLIIDVPDYRVQSEMILNLWLYVVRLYNIIRNIL